MNYNMDHMIWMIITICRCASSGASYLRKVTLVVSPAPGSRVHFQNRLSKIKGDSLGVCVCFCPMKRILYTLQFHPQLADYTFVSFQYLPVCLSKVFYEEELDVPLVLFNEVLDHVLRIDRIFRQPQVS